MAKFFEGTALNHRLEVLIKQADKFLYIISPYIKLHRRIKDALEDKIERPELQIVVMFGKNQEDKSKSVAKEDIDFLKAFPNITIAHHADLHAKFYATEDAALVTSLNLYDFSQNNNIEAGIELKPAGVLSNDDSYADAVNYFVGVINRSTKLFEKEAEFTPGIFSAKKYLQSKTTTDIIDIALGYKQTPPVYNKNTNSGFSERSYSTKRYNPTTTTGYCIRTGVEIPFDVNKPMCYEAYQVWAQFGNPDYPENYCHKTGKKSDGQTSMRNPVLKVRSTV